MQLLEKPFVFNKIQGNTAFWLEKVGAGTRSHRGPNEVRTRSDFHQGEALPIHVTTSTVEVVVVVVVVVVAVRLSF